jgi:hypothetical protein
MRAESFRAKRGARRDDRACLRSTSTRPSSDSATSRRVPDVSRHFSHSARESRPAPSRKRSGNTRLALATVNPRFGGVRDSSYAPGVADDTGSTGARIRFAIANRRLVEVRYSGNARIAEPHDYGIQDGRERLLVFQLRSPSPSNLVPVGWRRLDTAKIEALTVLDDTFRGSRGQS